MPRYQTSVALVSLNVTVSDALDRPVSGLSGESFAIYEDGVKQELSFFETRDVPLDVVLLIDASESMDDVLPVVRTASTAFAKILRPDDRGAVIAFNKRITVRQPFSGDPSTIVKAISGITSFGSTALYDSLYVAMRELDRETGPVDPRSIRRQAIVVLTDGNDTASVVSFDSVIDEVRRAGITLYALCVEPDSSLLPWGEKFDVASTTRRMTTLARETGGLSIMLRTDVDLTRAYARVADELTQQYLLAYISKNKGEPGALRRVTVRVPDRPDAKLRTRSAYLAPTVIARRAER